MKRPALWALIFLICGIVVGAYDGVPLFAMFIALAACVLIYAKYRYAPVFVFAVFMLIGLVRVQGSMYNHVLYPTQARVEGRVLDVGITGGGNQRVLLRTTDGMLVMAYLRPQLAWLEIGHDATMYGQLMPLAPARNPGGYNQFQHLRVQGVQATIWPTFVERGEMNTNLSVLLRSLRNRIAQVYEAVLPPREAAVARSMILGDRADMDADLAAQYRAMGIFHILSISGLHVGILMLALGKFMEMVLPGRRGYIVTLLIMVLYCLMTGASVATVRAVSMGGGLIFGKILRRKYDLLASVACVCIVLLVIEPLRLFDVGFQLSFTAVFGIAVLTAPIQRMLGMLHVTNRMQLRAVLAPGMAAVSATYIVFAFHMYEIQLYSIVGNFIIAPTTAILLVLGILVGLIGLVWLPAARVLAGTVYFILRFYDLASFYFSRLPFAMLLTGGGSLLVSAAGVLVLLSFAYAFYAFGDTFRSRLRLFWLACVLLILAMVYRHNPPGVHVQQLDTASNYTVMRHRNHVYVAGSVSGGEDALHRYLDRHGVRTASALILTGNARSHNVGSFTSIAPRVTTVYVVTQASYEFARYALAQLGHGTHVPEIVRLQDGSALVFGNASVQVAYQAGVVHAYFASP